MKRRCTTCILFALLISLLPGDMRAQSGGGEITVSAAISLKNAFEELGRLFESRQKNLKVSFNFGGSGALRNQIMAGAPVDVFASADGSEMDALEERGLVEPATRARCAMNRLVLIAPKESARLPASFADLRAASIERIALGNPRSVPAGRYAQETLSNLGLLPAVKDKLIYTENVRQALDYVARGEADAGLVYATDVRARESEVRIVSEAPALSHSPIEYPIAVVRGTRHVAASKAFIALVVSAEGRRILRRHGFSFDH